jgi:hypothetical protein
MKQKNVILRVRSEHVGRADRRSDGLRPFEGGESRCWSAGRPRHGQKPPIFFHLLIKIPSVIEEMIP